jgi:hypothetical protein
MKKLPPLIGRANHQLVEYVLSPGFVIGTPVECECSAPLPKPKQAWWDPSGLSGVLQVCMGSFRPVRAPLGPYKILQRGYINIDLQSKFGVFHAHVRPGGI